MSSLTVTDPRVQAALASCVDALRAVADFELDPDIAARLHDLGQRKEFLNADEHAELMALLGFTENRSVEKLSAQLALQKLNQIVPDLVGSP
jgi:hypothetical protein